MESVEKVMDSSELKEIKKMVRGKKIKKVVFRIGIIVILILATAVFSSINGRKKAEQDTAELIQELRDEIKQKENEIQELINTPIVVSPVAPQINLDIINSEIQEIGELATMEYLFTDAAKFTDNKQVEDLNIPLTDKIKDWTVPLTEKSFTVKWDGKIKAGVNVKKITVAVDENAKKLSVTLPKAEILSYEVDDDSVEVLDETDNKFNPITVADKVKFDAETKEAMIERAIENGILEKAQKSAEQIITNLLRVNPAIGDEYVIEFTVGK